MQCHREQSMTSNKDWSQKQQKYNCQKDGQTLVRFFRPINVRVDVWTETFYRRTYIRKENFKQTILKNKSNNQGGQTENTKEDKAGIYWILSPYAENPLLSHGRYCRGVIARIRFAPRLSL